MQDSRTNDDATGDLRRRPRIMLVEDDWLVAMDLADQLAEAGYEIVGPAPCIDRARALLETELVDAALLDIALDASSSYPAAEALMRSGIPFAFVTAQTARELRPDFQKHLLISKPVPRAVLVETVRDLLVGGLSAAPAPAPDRPA